MTSGNLFLTTLTPPFCLLYIFNITYKAINQEYSINNELTIEKMASENKANIFLL